MYLIVGGFNVNGKIISSIIVSTASVLAIVLIIMQHFNWAVFAMTVMFSVSNLFRAKSFKEDGYVRESKWMKVMGIFFAVAAAIALVVNIIG